MVTDNLDLLLISPQICVAEVEWKRYKEYEVRTSRGVTEGEAKSYPLLPSREQILSSLLSTQACPPQIARSVSKGVEDVVVVKHAFRGILS